MKVTKKSYWQIRLDMTILNCLGLKEEDGEMVKDEEGEGGGGSGGGRGG